MVTWSGVPFPSAHADSQQAITTITGLAVSTARCLPKVTVFASVSSERASVSVRTTLVTASRVVPGLRAKVTEKAAIGACAPDEPQTAVVETSEGFPSAIGPNNIMLTSDRGSMEGPPTATVGDLEFRRVDRFTSPRSGRRMYSVHGASNTFLELMTLALTGDEGEAGENIQVDIASVPREGADRQFVKSATLIAAEFEACNVKQGTTLRFPFVSNLTGFSTSIEISNPSQQVGSCELQWGADDGGSLAAPAQDQAVVRMDELGRDFQGYLLDRCVFANPLGYAYITDFEGQTQTYLAQANPN